MSILVTGSLAIDHIMVFPDRFKNHILPDRIQMLNVSFAVPTLHKSFGGTAGNIAYHLRLLGEDPLVLATVGSDFGEYAAWLDRCGVRRSAIRVLPDAFTAQCFITTDLDDNQIAAFHPGAMDRAHEAPLEDVSERIELGIVAPNGKQAMLDHAAALRARGLPTVIDPGQGLPLFSGEELLALLDGATVYVVNDYEWAVTRERTGLDEDALSRRVESLVVTRGERGSWIRQGGRRLEIPPVRAERVVDPTGCGDAYRAGLLAGLRQGRPLEVAGRMGSLLGALKVARQGTQALALRPEEFRARFHGEFGFSLG